MSELEVKQLLDRGERYRALRDSLFTGQYKNDLGDLPLDVSRLYKMSGALSESQIEVVELDATDLAQAIAKKTYTSTQVIEAYLLSAALAHSATNCLAWFFPEEALERARWLDEQLEKTGELVGPLHGVPISVKDFIMVKGISQTSGHIASSGFIPEEDAHIVSILRDAGAVFYAKTTMPQSIMHLETDSFLGVTSNPFNCNLTAGGSSGGEGALVGARGSPLGITTDIGGSTRGPAANNGLWGFKPTAMRLPKGMKGIMPGADGVAGAIGPIAHSLRDLDLFCRVLLDAQPWNQDINIPPMPWSPLTLARPIKIGVMWEDSVVRPVAPVRQAMREVVYQLRAKGMEVVDYPAYPAAEAWTMIKRLYYLDGAKKLREMLDGEPMLPLTTWITSNAQSQDIGSMWRLVNERDVFRNAYTKFFRSENFDAVLSPAAPGPAGPHGSSKYWSYTSFWNLLDWPALVFPTGHKVAPTDHDDAEYQGRNPEETEYYSSYSRDKAIGAPIGLQLSVPRFEDEKLFAVAKQVNAALAR
ncbi:hypothetical protein I316_06296 [Kwoniella heveanensis BCC8398]|uniref:Amidase domain-containing protein n=1 Tax=Kwoniella heveanensis BCC8398 TaxID=1296120 RepID=A0A1B9GM72_9TREE|nr:hypothetical protein I316_06296 [Kwoniella heveanensis BCC8398]